MIISALLAFALVRVEPPVGIEPTTYSLRVRPGRVQQGPARRICAARPGFQHDVEPCRSQRNCYENCYEGPA
jgi:hypothetical protein